MDKPIRNMEEFEKTYFPLDYAKKQREKRIAEVGEGRVMAEEALKKVFGKPEDAMSETAKEKRARRWRENVDKMFGPRNQLSKELRAQARRVEMRKGKSARKP